MAESRIQELRGLLSEKEALLEKAIEDGRTSENALKALFDLEKTKWAEEKESISAAFDRRAAELEAAINARAEALETEHAARKERLEAETAARAEALNAEAAAKMVFERSNWQAERQRFERALQETASHFSSAQKEIETLNLNMRRAAEAGAAREAAFNSELMEAKANYDKELSFRVKDAVSVQTAHLVEALESAKARQDELAANLAEKDNSIRALRAEGIETRRDYEEKLRAAASEAVASRRQELDQLYISKKQALEKETAALREELQNAYQARENELDRVLELKTARMEAENRALASSLEQLRSQAEAATAKASDVFGKMMAAANKHQEEISRLKEEHASEIAARISAAVKACTLAQENKLQLAQAELNKEREDYKKEVVAREKFFVETREKMAAEVENAKNYAEVLDFKVQDMEKEIAKVRQNAAAEFLGRISEQDEKIASLEARYKARQEKLEKDAKQNIAELAASYEAKLKDMEELVKAKEKLIQDSEAFWGRKQTEVDKAHSDFNLRINKFNEELFAQKQALGEKETALNDYRLKLEKEYAAKNAETEKMKAELTRTIIEYKNRK
jgi:hypothetical protein